MCWPKGVFLGCDCDAEQLRLATANAARRPVQLLRADAVRLPLAMASVDKAMTDLPFGKQPLRADLSIFRDENRNNKNNKENQEMCVYTSFWTCKGCFTSVYEVYE